MTVHVVGVRHGRGEQGKPARVGQRGLRLTDVLVGMGQKMVHREVIRRNRQRALIVAERSAAAVHAVRTLCRILSVANDQQELDVCGKPLVHLCELGPIRRHRPGIPGPVGRGQLPRPQINPEALPGTGRGTQFLRPPAGLPRAVRQVELTQGVAETELGHGQARIDPQRIVERPGRFDPDKRVQVGEALVVIQLRLRRGRRDGLMCGPDGLPQRHTGPLDGLLRGAALPLGGWCSWVLVGAWVLGCLRVLGGRHRSTRAPNATQSEHLNADPKHQAPKHQRPVAVGDSQPWMVRIVREVAAVWSSAYHVDSCPARRHRASMLTVNSQQRIFSPRLAETYPGPPGWPSALLAVRRGWHRSRQSSSAPKTGHSFAGREDRAPRLKPGFRCSGASRETSRGRCRSPVEDGRLPSWPATASG